jgi:hypothetical protein
VPTIKVNNKIYNRKSPADIHKSTDQILTTNLIISFAIIISLIVGLLLLLYFCVRRRTLSSIKTQDDKEVDSDPENLQNAFSPSVSPRDNDIVVEVRESQDILRTARANNIPEIAVYQIRSNSKK